MSDPRPAAKMSRRAFLSAASLLLAGGLARDLALQGWGRNSVMAHRNFGPPPVPPPRLRMPVPGTVFDCRGRTVAVSRLAEEAALHHHGPGRYYPCGADAFHLVGCLALGEGGVEREFAGLLTGENDARALQARYPPGRLQWARPVRASDLHLYLDADLQGKCARILERWCSRHRGRGAMVLLDVHTGGVVVEVSLPSLDPNHLDGRAYDLARKDVGRTPLLNRARDGRYPPGSTAKMILMMAAQRADVDPRFHCVDGPQRIRGKKVYDAEWEGHGWEHDFDLVEVSCNKAAANLAVTLGAERFFAVIEDLGLHATLEYLPSAQALDQALPYNGFGQGRMIVSPMELAMVAGVVATGGMLRRPVEVASVRQVGLLPRSPTREPDRRILTSGQAHRITQMMQAVVAGSRGTAVGVFPASLDVAGKTGTAWYRKDRFGRNYYHSWFTGFAPARDPRYAFACVIEDGGYGASAAAPAVCEMLKEVFSA